MHRLWAAAAAPLLHRHRRAASPTAVASRAIRSTPPRATQAALPTGPVCCSIDSRRATSRSTSRSRPTALRSTPCFPRPKAAAAPTSTRWLPVSGRWARLDHGTWSFSTMRQRRHRARSLLQSPIETLVPCSAGPRPPARSMDRICWAWDETDQATRRPVPRLARPGRPAVRAADPARNCLPWNRSSVTPDGSRVLFFNETGAFGRHDPCRRSVRCRFRRE